MRKTNPRAEWNKGFAVGKTLGISDFVIPLKTEDLQPHEIIWTLQPINYISFYPSWFDGMAALLKKLRSLNAPRALSKGPSMAVRSLIEGSAVICEPESLASNCFSIEQIPEYIREYKMGASRGSIHEWRSIQRIWPCWHIAPNRSLALHDPPQNLRDDYRIQCTGRFSWDGRTMLHGLRTQDLLVSLVRKSLEVLMNSKGIAFCAIRKQWYIPHGLVEKNRIYCAFPSGKRTWFRGVGQRKYPARPIPETYQYHMSPSFDVLRNQSGPAVVLLRTRVYFRDEEGKPLDRRKIVSRRKHLCKDWFNREWYVRTLGLMQLLADSDLRMRVGECREQSLVINATPITVWVPKSIDDDIVSPPTLSPLIAYNED